MKRTKFLVLLLLNLFLCSVSVWAEGEEDVWKPEEPFFLEHAEECVTMGREYYANGPNEQVIVYESPASSKVVKVLENAEIVLVDYVYTNDKGIEWGLCEFEGEFGWLPMPYMALVYDYMSFEEEYGDQFQMEKGEIVELTSQDPDYQAFRDEFLDSNRHIRFWSYPGSSRKFTIRVNTWGGGMPQYTKTFVDEDGRKWGFVGYFSGDNLNRWVCLSSVKEMLADFEELYPNGALERDKRVIEPYSGEEIFPDDYEHVQKMQKVKRAAITVGIVVIVAVVIIFYWKMWKKVKQV